MKHFLLGCCLLLAASWLFGQAGGILNGARSIPIPNDGTTGTQLNQLAIIDPAGQAILATTSNTNVPVYITTGGNGTSLNAALGVSGIAPCLMDSTIASGAGGYYVIASVTTGGYCHAQSAAPASGTGIVGYLVAASTVSGAIANVQIDTSIFGTGASYPPNSGIPIVVSGTSWGTTVAAPSGAIVGTTDTQLLSGKTFGPAGTTFMTTLTSTSNYASASGSMRLGPSDGIRYGCNPACSTSPITGSTDQNLIRGFGSEGPAQVGDYLGISTYPITLNGLTSGSCILSASATGGTLNICANASVDASGNFVGKSYTGIGAPLIAGSIPGSNFSPVASQSSLAVQTDGNWYASNNGGTFYQLLTSNSGISSLTSDVTTSGFGASAATVVGFNGVPKCASFSPTNGQLYTYTTGGSPNPCIAATTGSGGSVSNFSAGNLSPLFTSSVATASTTPALTFSLSNATAGTLFGNATGSAAGPTFTSTPVLGVSGTAGTVSFFPVSGNFKTTLGSVATASNTVNFFASVPANLDLFYCAVSSTTCTFTDTGYPYNAIPFADLTGVASSGANSNITSLTGLTTPLSIAQGGSGTATGAAQNSVFAGPASGGAAAPSFQTAPTISAANMTSFPTFNQNTTGSAGSLTGGLTFAAPGPIGGTTPGSGAFTTGTFSSTLGVTGLSTLTGGAIMGPGASTPGTCSVGQLFYQTGGTAGLYQCTATNTWTLNAASTGGLSGLTTNTVLKATAPTSAGNSSITENGKVAQIGNSSTAASLTVCGPGPWIDITCYGAKGDGLYNNTGGTSTTTGTTTLTSSSGATLFAATDCTGGSGCTGTVNKLITINAGGLGTPTNGTVATTTGGSLPTLSNFCIFITAIQDNASLPITSGAPSINGESLASTESCHATNSSTANEVTMTAPTLPANTTGYRFYAADESGSTMEVSQIIPGTANAACSAQSAKNIRDGACDPTATLTITTYTYAGFLPPQSSVWLSTLASFNNTRSVTLTDAIPSDVAGNTHRVSWGTANDTAYTNALAACPVNGGASILENPGCTIFFPPTGTQNSPANFTGRFASQNGIKITQTGVTLEMKGASTWIPDSGLSSLNGNWGTTSLWVMGRSWGVQYGVPGTQVASGGTEKLNVDDMSGVGYGGLFLTESGSTTTEHLQFNRFFANNFFSGYCIGANNIQIIDFNNVGGLCQTGFAGMDGVGATTWFNPNFVGVLNTSGQGWGMFFNKNNANSLNTGSNRVNAPQIRDFYQGHYRFKASGPNSIIEPKDENIALTGGASCGGGTACYGVFVQMDDVNNSGLCNNNHVVGGTFARAVNFFNIGVNCATNDIIEPAGVQNISGTVCTDSGTNDDIIVGNSFSSVCVNKLNGSFSFLPGSQKLSADSSGITATTAATATTIFTFTNLVPSQQYVFHCSGTTTQATAGAGIGIAIKATTTAPTNMEAHALVNTSATAINGQSSGNVTSTTATAVYTGATGTVTTQLPWLIDGSIETGTTSPASVTLGFFSISGSDSVVVKRDSFCTIGL